LIIEFILKIKMSLALVKKNYEHYLTINTEIQLFNKEEYHFHIVYLINCLINPNYMDWLFHQISLVTYMNSPIYIIATISKDNETEFKEKVHTLFPNVCIEIECYYENEFEYRGIKKVWELGQIHNKRNDIILYFHSKHITRSEWYYYVSKHDYIAVLKEMDKVKEIFTIFPSIDKVGWMSGGNGWIWINFWYARGSYISRVEKPLKTEQRFYYEDWLGRKVKPGEELICDFERPRDFYENTLSNCYGFSSDKTTYGNIGSYFCSERQTYFTI